MNHQAQAAVRFESDSTARVVEIYSNDIVGGTHEDPRQLDALTARGLEVVCLDMLDEVCVGDLVEVDDEGMAVDLL
jgi:hypothetical protein